MTKIFWISFSTFCPKLTLTIQKFLSEPFPRCSSHFSLLGVSSVLSNFLSLWPCIDLQHLPGLSSFSFTHTEKKNKVSFSRNIKDHHSSPWTHLQHRPWIKHSGQRQGCGDNPKPMRLYFYHWEGVQLPLKYIGCMRKDKTSTKIVIRIFSRDKRNGYWLTHR